VNDISRAAKRTFRVARHPSRAAHDASCAAVNRHVGARLCRVQTGDLCDTGGRLPIAFGKRHGRDETAGDDEEQPRSSPHEHHRIMRRDVRDRDL
jgi:hypothetical protein